MLFVTTRAQSRITLPDLSSKDVRTCTIAPRGKEGETRKTGSEPINVYDVKPKMRTGFTFPFGTMCPRRAQRYRGYLPEAGQTKVCSGGTRKTPEQVRVDKFPRTHCSGGILSRPRPASRHSPEKSTRKKPETLSQQTPRQRGTHRNERHTANPSTTTG